ncbi:hypothetical protein TNCV_2946661 [Trichonephila clavipes]|nr:hypothetical protein TNCV_2946661 [Trichonephila clavipes]
MTFQVRLQTEGFLTNFTDIRLFGWILDKHTAWRQKFWRQIFGDKVYNMATLPDCPGRWLKYGNPKTGQPKKSGEKWTSFIFALDPAATSRVRPCSYFLPHVFQF